LQYRNGLLRDQYHAIIPAFDSKCDVLSRRRGFPIEDLSGHRERFGKIRKLISRRGVSRGFQVETRQTWAAGGESISRDAGRQARRF